MATPLKYRHITSLNDLFDDYASKGRAPVGAWAAALNVSDARLYEQIARDEVRHSLDDSGNKMINFSPRFVRENYFAKLRTTSAILPEPINKKISLMKRIRDFYEGDFFSVCLYSIITIWMIIWLGIAIGWGAGSWMRIL